MIKNTNISTTEQTVHFDTSAETALKERKRQQEKALHDEASNLHWAREEGIQEGFVLAFDKLAASGMSEEEAKKILGINL